MRDCTTPNVHASGFTLQNSLNSVPVSAAWSSFFTSTVAVVLGVAGGLTSNTLHKLTRTLQSSAQGLGIFVDGRPNSHYSFPGGRFDEPEPTVAEEMISPRPRLDRLEALPCDPSFGDRENGPQAIGKSRGGWTTKIHMVAADARTAITFSLSPCEADDGVEGRKLLQTLPPRQQILHVIMDRAYEGNETRQLVLDLGFIPVVPPSPTGSSSEIRQRDVQVRNEVERLFRRLKGFRRIFSRFEKLDVTFMAFIHFALVMEAFRLC